MDKDFFVQEIEAHSGMLYRVAYTILRNDDACRDALQDAVMKAWEKRFSLREQRYFRTWITRILINACYDAQKKRRRAVSLEEGSVTYLSMPLLNGVATDLLHVQFFLCVAQIDPCTGEEMNCWTSNEHTAEIQIGDMLEEKTIYPVQQTNFGWFGFQSAHLKRYVTGVYINMTFAAEESMQPEDTYNLYEMRLCDQRGVPLPEDMMMGGSIDTSDWPQVVFTCMLGVEEMPEAILLTLSISVLAR